MMSVPYGYRHFLLSNGLMCPSELHQSDGEMKRIYELLDINLNDCDFAAILGMRIISFIIAEYQIWNQWMQNPVACVRTFISSFTSAMPSGGTFD